MWTSIHVHTIDPFIRIVRPSLFSSLVRIIEISWIAYWNQMLSLLKQLFKGIFLFTRCRRNQCRRSMCVYDSNACNGLFVIRVRYTIFEHRRSQELLVMNKTRVYSGCYWKRVSLSLSAKPICAVVYTCIILTVRTVFNNDCINKI